MSKRLGDFAKRSAASVKSLVKLVLLTRRATVKPAADAARALIVMGNGPSLADAIRDYSDVLRGFPAMAVNFAANAPEFAELRPEYYILADPHFFVKADDVNVRRLMQNLAAVDWEMRLFLPADFAASLPAEVSANRHICVERFNAVGIEGWHWLEDMAYSSGRGMPRPRNVLIPALMVGMLMGYKRIYVTGADHSWTKTLSVNERNEVVSVQPHFYKEDEHEVKRVRTDYLNYPLHTILYSFYVAFKSYFDIRRFADSRGVAIYNSTPGSFIDALERRPLSELRDEL